MFKVIEVTNRKDLKAFVRFPTWLYRGSKLAATPLEIDEFRMMSPKNPSWEDVEIKIFIAVTETGKRRVLGRIAVMIQQSYNKRNNAKNARFTRFDVVDNKDVAFALLDAAVAFARDRGMQRIHGPLGFNDLDREGLLVEGFDRMATFVNTYNYAYYKTFIEEYGFEKEADWLEFIIKLPKEMDERIIKISDRMKDRLGVTLVPESMSIKKIVDKYGAQIFELLNVCYADLHGVVPVTEKVGLSVLKQFKQIVRREHLCMVLDSDGKLIAFGLTAPNISRSLNKAKGRICKAGFIPINGMRIKQEAAKSKFVDLCLIAVAPDYQSKGVSAIIMNQMFKKLVARGITFVESNLQLETNTSIIKLFESLDRELVKKRRCYVKEIK